MKTAYRNATFFTMDEGGAVYEDGLLIVEGTSISYIGPSDAGLLSSVDAVTDLDGKWVMPGLVNAHTHVLMTIMRGIGDDMPLQPWLETRVFPTEAKFDTRIAIASARLGILEMLKSGTTTINDMFNPAGIDADAVLQAVGETGIAGAFSPAVFSFGPEQAQREILRLAERFARDNRSYDGGRLTAMVAPHSPYAASPKALETCAGIARQYGVMVHIHISETEREVRDSESRHGVRPVEFARRLGLFDGPAILAHGVVLSEEERLLLRDCGVAVAHNPVSNLKLGSGIADVSRLLELGVRVGIGTDGAASNNNLDLFEELRTAALLQKGLHKDAAKLPARTALELATRRGAEALGMPDAGSLKRGKRADFITISPSGKPHLQPVAEAYSHLAYSASGKDVSDVYVHGRQLVKNGECLTIDEERVLDEVNRLHAGLKRGI